MAASSALPLACLCSGESSTLAFDERVAVTKAVVAAAAGRAPIVMGGQTTSTLELIRLARAAASIAAGVAAPTILAWPAGAAEFAYKYGTALPDGHPMAIRSREAVAKIKE